MCEVALESAFQLKLALIWSGDAEDMWCYDKQLAGKRVLFALVRVGAEIDIVIKVDVCKLSRGQGP
jgi:hypothetical protein